ncbi:DUF2169 family type VI secretion system accessory protein [Cystobacter ferrugineus]|uniref:DUF2169 family type VI secretion system accessory protein n=1 Tax=Cystobacter ferrugineus TaxID=83449 RepID=UPI0009033D09|nr:DUF2169 domain-containing protein [Cystobacter ferrugineus]
MPNLKNLCPFAVADFPSLTKEGLEVLVVCASGRFRLPPAGRPSSEPLKPSEEQPLPPLADVYWGEPGRSSLRHEAQTAWVRPGTDVYVSATAWAPGGRPVSQMLAAVRVGPCRKGVQVWGDRIWTRGVLGPRPSEPKPFESMSLLYEHSFGGVAQSREDAPPQYEPRNPVGHGFYTSVREAMGCPLPNIEDPLRCMEGPTDRVEPVGLGPIARGWQPRLALAGTYDAQWVERRAPLWARDFDERFFFAAAPGLRTDIHLRGGEEVVLSGCSPDGQYAFLLPRCRLGVKVYFRHRKELRALRLDAVHLEPDEHAVTLIWRATIPAHRQLSAFEYGVVRELEPWEECFT